ncbi:hypothetical protein [Kitasatospora sp. McL0602]|uniref:hypothetical protein n=1 Tax=Kitasatospora sp. McL0602 TaxID=3439530 RepID=UPI003F89911D
MMETEEPDYPAGRERGPSVLLPLSLGAVLMGLVLVVTTVWMARLDGASPGSGAFPSAGAEALSGDTLTQVDYALRVRQDQQALDRGLLVHTVVDALDVGDDAEFSVKVFDLGRAAETSGPVVPVLPPGVVAAPDNVPTGGDLSVTLECEHIICSAYDSARKPVVGKGSTGVWTFGLTAHETGQAHLHIVTQVYRGSSDEVLVGAVPVDVDISVRRTWSYTASRAAGWLLGTGPGIGLFSGGVAAGTAGTAWRWVRGRRRRTDVERVLAAIPRAEQGDRLLFGLLHETGRPVREVLAVQGADVRLGRGPVAVGFPGAAGATRPVPIADRGTARLLRRAAESTGGRLLTAEGEPLSLPRVEQRWERHCSRLGLDLPLGALGR